ncbi:hypothetical protein AURDEDRAFT_175632 [Auricularia subglabra TFB-10046 SS5]|uniref:Uncharacterized protein n=1 Tax=Auricularia subglabra (strain TFB-10046 / SS5) TaxID=717982 RepID=J0WRJ0_AURST|nr:hypothetical protein AURDEDRAFT_175632 [Auricularia subglabra TFB-10046 SS5]
MSLPASSVLDTQTCVALDLVGGDQNVPLNMQELQGGRYSPTPVVEESEKTVHAGDDGPPAPSPAFSNTTDNGMSPMRPPVVRKEPPSPAAGATATVQQWLKKSRQHEGDPSEPHPASRAPPPPLSFGQVKAVTGHTGPRFPPLKPGEEPKQDVFGPKAAPDGNMGSRPTSAASGARSARRAAQAEHPSTTYLWSDGHNSVRTQSGMGYRGSTAVHTPPPVRPLYATGAHLQGNQGAALAAAQLVHGGGAPTLYSDYGLNAGWTKEAAAATAKTHAHIEFHSGHVEHPAPQYPPGLTIRGAHKAEPPELALSDVPDGTQASCDHFCPRPDCAGGCYGDHGPLRFTPEQVRREAAGLADDRPYMPEPLRRAAGGSERTATSDAGTDDMDLYEDAPPTQAQPGSQPNLGDQLDDDPIDGWSDAGGARLGDQLEDEPQRPPLTDDQRSTNAAIAPEFRHSSVAMRATAIVREPIDGARQGQFLHNMDATDRNVFDAMVLAKKKIFGIFLHSVDGNTNIAGMNQTLLNMDFQDTLRQTEPGSKLALAPIRASQHGPPVRPGLFIAHNLHDRTHRNYTDRTFFMVDKYCFGTFIYDHGNSFFFGTWWNTMMPRGAMETEFRTACSNSARVRRVFLDIEVKHPGQGQLAWACFRESLEVRELPIVPKRGDARITPEYNIYSRPVTYKVQGKTVNLTPAQYDNLQAAMATVRVPSTLLGAATKRPSYDCPICMAKSHPRGMCPALGIPGWAHVLPRPPRPPKPSGPSQRTGPQLPPPLHFGPPKRGRTSRVS